MAQGGTVANNVGMVGGKLDFEFLLRMLNPALFALLAGGILLGFDVVPLIFVGVVGYTVWGVLNLVYRRKKRRAMLADVKNAESIKVPFDFGLVASILNPAILLVLAVGIVQSWQIEMLVAIGVVGYGFWFFLNYLDRKGMKAFTASVERGKKSKKSKVKK